jgi:hypothetical protein
VERDDTCRSGRFWPGLELATSVEVINALRAGPDTAGVLCQRHPERRSVTGGEKPWRAAGHFSGNTRRWAGASRVVVRSCEVVDEDELVRRRNPPGLEHNLTDGQGAATCQALLDERRLAAENLVAPLSDQQRAALLELVELIAPAESTDPESDGERCAWALPG